MFRQHLVLFGTAVSLGLFVFSGFAQQEVAASNAWFKEFVFLPGGARGIAKTISATNENFRQAMLYIGAVQAGRTPPKLPAGLTQADISNAEYRVFTWPQVIPPNPILFYGAVVDENLKPVAGATAHFEWDTGISTKKMSTEVTTDANGLFSLTSGYGIQLNVEVGKAGYYSSHTNRGFSYFKYSKSNFEYFYRIGDFFEPDAAHPVVYHLRKIGVGANSLVTSQYGFRESFWVTVPKDGTPVKVDLLNQKTGNGALEIRQKKPEFPAHGGTWERMSPSDRAKFASATNWSLSMKISNGGFVEENDEFGFNPPEGGYQPTINYTFHKGEKEWPGNWSMKFEKSYYVKLGSPAVYGQLRVETWSDKSTVILTYVINPDGSRNLEPKQGYFPSSSRWTH